MVAMIVLLATAMFALITFIGVKQRNHDLKEAQDLTARFAGRAAAEIGELAAGTELLLSVISNSPLVQQRNAPAVNQLLADIVKQHPRYANLIVMDKSGLLWSSAVPFKGAVSYSDRRYFLNGIATGRFSSGEYTVGRLIASPVMTYGLPVKNPSGEIIGLTAAVIRLERYKELLDEQRPPQASAILLTDHRGVILYHSRLPPLAGKPDRADIVKQMQEGPGAGSFQPSDDQDSHAITYYHKIWLPGEQAPYMYVRVSVPYDAALNKANSELLVNILLMSSLVLLAVGIASHISKRYIIDKITSLQDAARKIARGDLDVRIAESVSGGELGALGHAFDDMARSIARDSAERKQAMEALRKSEVRLSRAQEVAHLGNWEYEIKTGTITWSDEAYRIFGFAPQEVAITADLLMSMIHPEDRGTVEKALSDVRGGLGHFNVEYRIIRRDNTERHVHSQRYVFIGEEQPGRIFGMVQDITERKAIENALRETTERFRTMFEQAPLGIALTDSSMGRFDEVNEKFAEIAGRPKDEMAHMDWISITHPDDVQANLDAMASLNAGKITSFDMNKRCIRPDGSAVWIHMTVARLQGEDQAHPRHLCMIEDITERRRMDQELMKAQKLESIGVLAGGLAHDFNNLLGGLFGYIEMAKLEAEDRNQKEIVQYLSKALNVFDRAKELTQQLLTFSKGGAPILKSQSIAELLRRTISFALSGSNTHPNFFIPDDLWLNEFDETQMAQVFDNIAVNARQAMPEGGNIDVTAQNRASGEGAEMDARERYVLVTIRDHGTGIRPEHLPHIFDPFFTTKLQGSGLGLSACYSIIKQHGGRIEVDSEIGKGTSFRIYLPASKKPAAPAKTGETLELPFRPVQTRILVMDDEPFILDIASTILKQIGCDVVTAANGDEAITRTSEAMESGRPFMAAILDLTIPGGRGGKETAPQLLKMDPNIKVIVSSGYSDDPVIARPAEYGFSGRLIKPYRRDTVAQLFRSLIDSNSHGGVR